MPAYNAASYIISAMQSVLDQTYRNWELLIVDDASTDDTLNLVSEIARNEARIKVFPQLKNGGVSVARNLALKNAAGDYIAFLDSDDLWDQEKLEKQLNFMQSSGCQICYTPYRRIDEDGRALGTVQPPEKVTYSDLLRSNFIGNLTGIYHAKSLGKQYLTDFRHEDYIAWLNLVKKAGQACAVNEVLASYRVYSGSTSGNKLRTIGWQWLIYRKSQSLGLLESTWLMVCYGVYAIMKRI